MENDPVYIAFSRAVKAGIKQTAIASATGISEDSIRQFKKNGSLGPEKREILGNWLRENNFTQRETPSDVLLEVRSKLAGCIDVLDNAVHPRSRKARICLNQLKVLVGEYGSELEKLGLEIE